MSVPQARRALSLVLLSALVTLFTTLLPGGVATARQAASTYVVQGVPDTRVDVSVDGNPGRSGVAAKQVVGPLGLSPGHHTVSFSSPDWKVTTSVTVHGSQDVVLHWPADAADKPVVTVFTNDVSAVGSGKGRLTVAHTAVVPPADITADGKTLFTNIANGEFADADVPAGAHEVALLPTGDTKNPLLGPLTLTLPQRTATMVYAVGSPQNGSMDAIVHRVAVRPDGSVAPRSIATGSAGLARHVQVVPFGHGATPSSGSREHTMSGADHALPWFAYGLVGLLLVGLTLWWRRGASAVPTGHPPWSIPRSR